MDICRLCMEESNLNQSMTDETIQVMVENCIQLKLDIANDVLPVDICDDCYYKVKDFYEFKENCHTIQGMLRKEIEDTRSEQQSIGNGIEFSLFGDDIQYSEVEYINGDLLFGDISTDDLLSDVHNNNSSLSFDNDSNNNDKVKNNEIQTKEIHQELERIETGKTTDSPKRVKRCYKDEYNAALLACEVCGKMVHKTLIPGHLNMHKGIKPFVCPIEGCTSAFHCKHKLKRHLGYKHTNGNYPCNKCEKVFNSNLALYHHKFAAHKERDKVCGSCDKRFGTTHALNRHMQTHTQDRPFKCSHCPMAFSCESEREDHERIHTNERPFVCGKCNADYSYRRLLVNHIKRKHPGSELMLLQAIECL